MPQREGLVYHGRQRRPAQLCLWIGLVLVPLALVVYFADPTRWKGSLAVAFLVGAPSLALALKLGRAYRRLALHPSERRLEYREGLFLGRRDRAFDFAQVFRIELSGGRSRVTADKVSHAWQELLVRLKSGEALVLDEADADAARRHRKELAARLGVPTDEDDLVLR